MDPCAFVRLMVESLALKLPQATKPAGTGVHPSTTPCFCKLRIKNFPSQTQTALVPLCTTTPAGDSPPDSDASAGFSLDPAALRRGKAITLRVSVYTGRMGRTCGVSSGKLLGRVNISVDLEGAQARPTVFQNGWMKLGNNSARIHILLRSEPDPRFVFQFGGEPECSPVVFQIQHNIRQPVFSCKFSADRNSRSRSLPSDFTNTTNRGWMRTFSGDKERSGRERKGWMIMIYDLSGSPVAAASMITPFVPSPGTDRVSRSNPGAWLILRPNGFSVSSWKPWGRFVMGSTVEGEGKVSKPVVQVGVQHVTCMADAALFIALSAAIDLSMDACRMFSHKLRKELCHDDQDSSF
ncbi:hypothetical protein CFP56_013284 [Quercus suber]|uniref:DUF1005 family protein n=1 Tax=Quercus suber TaxID=58331 RepID=A0AAW0IZX4_QUESU